VKIQPLAEMLEDLLWEASGAGGEVCLAEALVAPQEDLEALRAEYAQRYGRAIASVSERCGPAHFEGVAQESELSAVSHCERIAYWHRPAGLIYVGLMASDTALAVVGGAAPNVAARNADTLLPPPD
jgi:hypothetical protein